MKILVTGTAGFIGSTLALKLLARGDEVIGVDNINDYYDVDLKLARLERVKAFDNFTEVRGNIEDRDLMEKTFREHQPQRVVNLAAQAGVRYSLENPYAYIDANILGFMNVLENCRHTGVEHLVYASTSSVYGNHTNMPFSTHESVDHPVSLYAATKKSNELMAHTYSHLFKLPTTGLRFFTVYGPWGRPDMALFLFTKNILAGKPIDVFNYGKHKRDFTFVEDIVEGLFARWIKSPQRILNSIATIRTLHQVLRRSASTTSVTMNLWILNTTFAYWRVALIKAPKKIYCHSRLATYRTPMLMSATLSKKLTTNQTPVSKKAWRALSTGTAITIRFDLYEGRDSQTADND